MSGSSTSTWLNSDGESGSSTPTAGERGRFKPGDRVRVTKSHGKVWMGDKGAVMHGCGGSPVRTAVRIDRLGATYLVPPDALELIPPPTPAPDAQRDRFKPGDRVRVTRDTHGLKADAIGAFMRLDPGNGSVALLDMGTADRAWLADLDALELIPPEPPAPDARREQVDSRVDRCPRCDSETRVSCEYCGNCFLCVCHDDCRPADPTRREQVGGDHYTRLAVQPWDVIEATATPEGVYWYFAGNVIKYVMRAARKGGLQDLRKARHYLDRLITLVESGKAACGAVRAPGEGE